MVKTSPRLRSDERVAEADLVGPDPALAERVRQRQRVARGACDHVRSKILDEGQLAFRHPAGHWDHRHAEALAAAVEAEPAREEPVAVGVVEHHPRLRAAHRERARGDAGEEVEVPCRVRNDRWLPGRPGGGMDASELARRRREHSQRVRVAEVVLARDRKPPEIVERADILRLDVLEPLPVERNALLDVGHERPEALELQRAELLAGHGLELGLEDHRRSIPPADAIVRA